MANVTEAADKTFKNLVHDINQHWMIYAGSIVFLMQAGFSLLEAGSVSAKNSTNILFKNLLDAAIAAVCFFAWGYAFAYGKPSHPESAPKSSFIGTSNFFLSEEKGDNYRSFFFQWAFAATAATIVSGAVAERIKIQAYFLYSLVITSIIYPVVVHWVWSDHGFMCNWNPDVATNPVVPNSVNLIDFAGSGVVHLTGGVCALIGAIFTGPRRGRFKDNRYCGCFTPRDDDDQNGNCPCCCGRSTYSTAIDENEEGRRCRCCRGCCIRFEYEVVPHEAHDRVFTSLGVLILWFGWYGFNAGSTLDISGYGTNASRVTVTTTLAAAAGAISAMIYSMTATKPRCKQYDVMAPLNGILAGLVSITAGCAVVTPQGALGIGFLGGLLYSFSSWLLKTMRIDDPLDAFSVHGACGIWGVIATGFFGVRGYICADPTKECFTMAGQTSMQIVGVFFIILWTSATSAVLFGLLRIGNLLRVKRDVEIHGLDMDHHLGYTGILRYEQEMQSTVDGMEIEEGSISISNLPNAEIAGEIATKQAVVVVSDST